MDISVWFLEDEDFSGEAFPATQSAFVQYSDRGRSLKKSTYGPHRRSANIHKRMIKMLKKVSGGSSSEPQKITATTQPVRERSFLHMVNERMRRASEKKMYSSLHSVLPVGTKSDKNSIVKAAIKEIQEMERHKEELQRRNNRLVEMTKLAEKQTEDDGAGHTTMMRLSVPNPAAGGIYSMVAVLKCLKKVGCSSSARRFRSKFSVHEFLTELEIDSKITSPHCRKSKRLQDLSSMAKLVKAEEFEKEVGRTLKEDGKKFYLRTE